MPYYAVIDTNVLVAALLSSHDDSAVVQVIKKIGDRIIVPLYSDEIIAEYKDVLYRSRLAINHAKADYIIDLILNRGIKVEPKPSGLSFNDPDDLVFYETAIAMKSDGAYLITGNKKHFPHESIVVTASEYLKEANI